MEFKGIDVSTHQGIIDWNKVKEAGIQFAIIRAGYGTESVDSQFKRNADECTRLNIPFGAYWYSYARNLEESKLEVKKFIDTIKQYKLSYPAIIDMEDADGYKSKNGVSNSTCIDICELECLELEKAGYYAMIYANLDWFKNRIDNTKLDRFDKWLAQWSSKPIYNKKFGIWQYTSSGQVIGINGRVDMNIAYSDYPSIIGNLKNNNISTPIAQKKAVDELAREVIDSKWGNGNDRKIRLEAEGYDYNLVQAKVNEILGVKPKVTEITYIVQSGDNLSSIAKKYNTTWQKLYEKNKGAIGSNPNKIYKGQVLKV